MTDPAIRELARQLADLKRQMTALSTSNRLSHSALEPTGRIVQYDEDGVPLAVVGAQDDGTFGTVTYYGPPPPVASVPVVEGGPGYATITWDGRYEDIEARAPNDFQAVEVWAAPEGTTPTALHRRVTFTDPAGGSVVGGVRRLPADDAHRLPDAPPRPRRGRPDRARRRHRLGRIVRGAGGRPPSRRRRRGDEPQRGQARGGGVHPCPGRF